MMTEEDKAIKKILTQCFECSSNDTIIKDNEMYCNNCGGYYVL